MITKDEMETNGSKVYIGRAKLDDFTVNDRTTTLTTPGVYPTQSLETTSFTPQRSSQMRNDPEGFISSPTVQQDGDNFASVVDLVRSFSHYISTSVVRKMFS
mmetsp:Transcript_14134/g.39547  ORF Transcript_14134/g.39547 Transcript_14134/m.39547 type:complete len:102 (-) Transcript_14134:1858-2163(-)